jgi:hypothetical protein
MVATFILEPEAVMRAIISLIAKTAIPQTEIAHSLLRRLASDLDQRCFIFDHVSEVPGESRARNAK